MNVTLPVVAADAIEELTMKFNRGGFRGGQNLHLLRWFESHAHSKSLAAWWSRHGDVTEITTWNTKLSKEMTSNNVISGLVARVKFRDGDSMRTLANLVASVRSVISYGSSSILVRSNIEAQVNRDKKKITTIIGLVNSFNAQPKSGKRLTKAWPRTGLSMTASSLG